MHNNKAQNGFTLIEVMIVVAIIAILATVSYSSYRNNVVRANRAAAASYVLEVANMQERYLLDNRDYATGNADGTVNMATLGATPPPEVSDNYTITTGDDNATAVPSYFVRATPTGAQAADDSDCGWLNLTNTGTKTTQYGGSRCWR